MKNNVNHLLWQLAVSCNYDNPPLQSSFHRRRQLGLSKCANHGVAGAAMLQIDGHVSHKTSAGYKSPNQQSADWIIAAKHGSPSKIWADLKAYQAKKKACKKSSPEPPSVNLFCKKPSPKPLFSPSALHFCLSQDISPIAFNHKKENVPINFKNPKSTKFNGKKSTVHCDYVDNHYQIYTGDADDRKPPPFVDLLSFLSSDSSASSEAGVGKLGLQTQLAMRPKKKKKKKKVCDYYPRRITINNHHYGSPLSPALAYITNQKWRHQKSSSSSDSTTNSPSPPSCPTKWPSKKKLYKHHKYYQHMYHASDVQICPTYAMVVSDLLLFWIISIFTCSEEEERRRRRKAIIGSHTAHQQNKSSFYQIFVSTSFSSEDQLWSLTQSYFYHFNGISGQSLYFQVYLIRIVLQVSLEDCFSKCSKSAHSINYRSHGILSFYRNFEDFTMFYYYKYGVRGFCQNKHFLRLVCFHV